MDFNEMYSKLTVLKETRDALQAVFEKASDNVNIYNELCSVDQHICEEIDELLKGPVSYAES